MSEAEILFVILCLLAGGVIKGATGAGAPILAIPAISVIVDLRFAIVALLATAILTNIWQAWAYRERLHTLQFLPIYLMAAGAGMIMGTLALAHLPLQMLTIVLVLGLVFYIATRLARPDWVLSMEMGRKLAAPAGFAAGILQGGSGLSGPAALSYLSSLKLGREGFAGTISLLFLVLGLFQVPMLAAVGILTWQGLGISLLALIPVICGMFVGNSIGKRFSPQTFDRMVLIMLVALTLKLLFDLVSGWAGF